MPSSLASKLLLPCRFIAPRNGWRTRVMRLVAGRRTYQNRRLRTRAAGSCRLCAQCPAPRKRKQVARSAGALGEAGGEPCAGQFLLLAAVEVAQHHRAGGEFVLAEQDRIANVLLRGALQALADLAAK